MARDRCMRRCAGRSARPSCARFESRKLIRRQHIMIDLIRRLAIERRVRASLIELVRIKREFPVERLTAKWHEDLPRTFVLETQDESFNECDTAVLDNGAKAGRDPLSIHQSLNTPHQNCWSLSQMIYFGLTSALSMAYSRTC